MKASPECLNILIHWKKFKQEYSIYRYIDFATIFYIKLPTSTAALLVVNSMNH